MKVITGTLILAVFITTAHAQKLSRINNYADITGTAGSNQGTAAAAYAYNLRFGKNRKLEIGLGIRNTTYFGLKKDFITAGPAKLTRTSTFPFLIFFAGQREQNFDTLTVQRPLTNLLNLTINLGYNFSEKLNAGFNIDVIGFTFGRNSSAIFASNGHTSTEPVAKPASFNVLLTGDHDYGSLNSEFFLKYKIGDRLSIKALYQFIFIEYKTTTTEQIAPDGTVVTRFRNKANNFGLGLSYQLHAK